MKTNEASKRLIREYTGYDEELRDYDICPRCLNSRPMDKKEICDQCEASEKLWIRLLAAQNKYKNKYGDN